MDDFISQEEVVALSTNDRIKALDPTLRKIYIDGAKSVLCNYTLDVGKEGFTNAAKLGSILIIDFLAFSNIGGGAFEYEKIADIWYSARTDGLKKKIQEVELILGPYILSGSGNKKIARSRMVRVRNGRCGR